MSKFNDKPTIKTTNRAGGVAYKMSDKAKLVSMVLTSFVNEKKYYGDNTSEMMNLIAATAKTDPLFLAQLGNYARTEFNMRSVSHLIAVYLAKYAKGNQRDIQQSITRRYIRETVIRPDDMTEILALYLNKFGKPIPNSLKKGLGDAFAKFDEYQLAKYDRAGKVTLKDILCVCRPNPKNDDREALYGRLLADELQVPYTWETELSAKGNNKETWEGLIESGKLGYMALLRNLRNILNADVSTAAFNSVCETLADKNRVIKSRQLPFRFYSAYKEIQNNKNCNSKLLDALEDATEASLENAPKLTGNTLIAIDSSGSMSWGSTGSKSNISPWNIAAMIGTMATKMCDNFQTVTFDSVLRQKNFSSRNGILATVSNMGNSGGATHMYLVFDHLHRLGSNKFDRVIILSDNQAYGQLSGEGYSWYGGSTDVIHLLSKCRRDNPNLWVHSIDIEGQGTAQFAPDKRNNFMFGWSEKMLEFISLAEQSEDTMIKKIERVII